MISKANESAGAAIKHAIETRNANMLSKLYTDDATLRALYELIERDVWAALVSSAGGAEAKRAA